ncbi:MAG: hypothetical protein SPI09_05065 [Candidatus Limivicinus sp.]|nr:hypothetical protein [Clostridiales bacterium]MCI7136452.1 hypothetical protein [Clostridiales bacterium]MDY6132715.1 hypothetical protein [Candidatus Limivicinus sp.]
MARYKRQFGDRKEGRLLRSLPAFNRFMPYIMPVRNDACNQYEESFEVSAVDRRLRRLRVEGYKGIGILHFLIAAYIRGVAMLPGINRFVVGRRIYARNNIEVVMTVKRSLSLDATETTIKVQFEPTDTIFDVYRKMNEKIDEIKTGEGNNNTEDVAEALARLPRFLLRFAILILRIMDYFGWLPEALTDASPFHGSMIITDLGSLRIGPIYHHIYNFGTLPVFIAFGAKRHAYELDRHGNMVDHKYVDCKMVMDERTVDGHYYAQFLQAYRLIFQHPEILETPPTRVNEDVR